MKTVRDIIEGLCELAQDFQDSADNNSMEFERRLEAGDMEGLIAVRNRMEVWTEAADGIMDFVDSIDI